MLPQTPLGLAGGKHSPVSSEGPLAAAGLPESSKRHSLSLSSISAWVSSTSKQRQMQLPTRPGLQEPRIHRPLRQLWKIQMQRPQQTRPQSQLGNRHPPAHTQAQVLHRSKSLQGCSGGVVQANACPLSRCIMACRSTPALCLSCILHLLQHQRHQHRKQMCWTLWMQIYSACSRSYSASSVYSA